MSEKGSESEEKHYTKTAKYAKLSSTVVSTRPAMLKAENVSKVPKVKSKGPQIIEPHFASTSPKAKVNDKAEKPKVPVKLPEATSAKKALASFKIPKHKTIKITTELTSEQAVKIPALDVSENPKETSQTKVSHTTHTPETTSPSTEIAHSSVAIQSSKLSPEKDTAHQGGKNKPETNTHPSPVKESKAEKTSSKSTKASLKKSPASLFSNLDAGTLQALASIVQQTLQMVQCLLSTYFA